MKKTRPFGFTLIELMITVVIIGVLAAIAFPSYRNYMVQTRRSDAQIALTKAAAVQEKFYSDCGRFASTLAGTGDCPSDATRSLNLLSVSGDGHYTIAAPAAGTIGAGPCGGASAAYACGFTMTATPVAGGKQDGDGAFKIDSTGVKCWDKNADGNCTTAGDQMNWQK